MSIKTYSNKSNARRAFLKLYPGADIGTTAKLFGKEGAWYYDGIPVAPAASKKAAQAAANTRLADASVRQSAKPAPAAAHAKKAPPLPKGKAKAKPAPRAASAAVPVATWDAATGAKQGRITGYTIDTDRDERHGVKRRSAGTIGGSLWAIYDKLAKGAPESLAIADVKEHQLVAEYNANKVMIEFYLWRRYHGVRGRGSKQKVDR
jgi:hypothetical protein